MTTIVISAMASGGGRVGGSGRRLPAPAVCEEAIRGGRRHQLGAGMISETGRQAAAAWMHEPEYALEEGADMETQTAQAVVFLDGDDSARLPPESRQDQFVDRIARMLDEFRKEQEQQQQQARTAAGGQTPSAAPVRPSAPGSSGNSVGHGGCILALHFPDDLREVAVVASRTSRTGCS